MKSKTKNQRNRGWFRSMPELNNKIVCQEIKRFKFPKGLTLNTILKIRISNDDFNLSVLDYLNKVLTSNTLQAFQIKDNESYIEIALAEKTYTAADIMKSKIDNMYSAILAAYSIKRATKKLNNYAIYGKTSSSFDVI
jgi:hypothetical protein